MSKKRKCYCCGSSKTYVNKTGSENWFLNHDQDNNVLCHKCNSKFYQIKNKTKIRIYQQGYRIKNYEKLRLSVNVNNKKIRISVLAYYSQGTPQCVCCGEKTLEFLSLDHKEGKGTQHRKQIKKSGTAFYRWIKQNSFPEGYQVLCHNCNMAKSFYGSCPHTWKVLLHNNIEKIGEK